MNEMGFKHDVLVGIVSERNLTITDVAKLTGLTASQVYNLLNKKTTDPRSSVVTRLSRGLGVEWPIFYGLDIQKKKKAV